MTSLEQVVRYSIDTSALIYAWNQPYKPVRFPAFWKRMEELIRAGELAASDEVRQELSRKEDDLHKWVQQRSGLFVPLEEDIQQESERILARFDRLIDKDSPYTQADPFVIALAKVNECKVVTQEKYRLNDESKIPYVCRYYSIECIDLYAFVAEQDWVFD